MCSSIPFLLQFCGICTARTRPCACACACDRGCTRFFVYGFCVWWTSVINHCVEFSLVCTLVCSTYPSTCALFLTHSFCSPSHMYIHLLTYLQTYLLPHTCIQRIGIESSIYVFTNRMLLDTHSSRGMFELTSKEAARSPEHLQGKLQRHISD